MDYQAHLSTVLSSGTCIPRCIYGTAEKTDPEIILDALKFGYRGFDTACQPQYYHEEVVGHALSRAMLPEAEGGMGINRTELYIQTKFTTPAGQDETNAPYEFDDPTATKVHKSLQASLSSLKLCWVDTLLLHGPMPTIEETIEVWKIMETLVPDRARNIGLSNVTIEQVKDICEQATVLPATVQNRFCRRNGYDRELRRFCEEKNIKYQAFSILRSNRHLLNSNLVGWLAEIKSITTEEALLSLVLSIGKTANDSLCILNGTKNAQRMESSLNAFEKLGKVPAFIMHGFDEELQDKGQNRI